MWENSFDSLRYSRFRRYKTKTALEAGPEGSGIGYARTSGNFQAVNCLEEVPEARRSEAETSVHGEKMEEGHR